MKLYSYCIPVDDGAAPNPYWGICTLTICKPAIRRIAEVGDWIAGLGSMNSSIGDISSSIVYAMRVDRVLSMREYDAYCNAEVQRKIPDWDSSDFRRRVGDCIYDFSSPTTPRLRLSVHNERNRSTDLGGRNALLSRHFYYFGDQPRSLPKHLQPIVHSTQGHKSHANDDLAGRFVKWISRLGLPINCLVGQPQLKHSIMSDSNCRERCSTIDLEADRDDALC